MSTRPRSNTPPSPLAITHSPLRGEVCAWWIGLATQTEKHPLAYSQVGRERSSDSGCCLFDLVEQTSLDKVGSLTDSDEGRGCVINA